MNFGSRFLQRKEDSEKYRRQMSIDERGEKRKFKRKRTKTYQALFLPFTRGIRITQAISMDDHLAHQKTRGGERGGQREHYCVVPRAKLT